MQGAHERCDIHGGWRQFARDNGIQVGSCKPHVRASTAVCSRPNAGSAQQLDSAGWLSEKWNPNAGFPCLLCVQEGDEVRIRHLGGRVIEASRVL